MAVAVRFTRNGPQGLRGGSAFSWACGARRKAGLIDHADIVPEAPGLKPRVKDTILLGYYQTGAGWPTASGSGNQQ
jgi:hypothetical protein